MSIDEKKLVFAIVKRIMSSKLPKNQIIQELKVIVEMVDKLNQFDDSLVTTNQEYIF